MWYDMTQDTPSDIVATMIHEIGPSMDAQGVPLDERAVILNSRGESYLFATLESLVSVDMSAFRRIGYVGSPFHSHRMEGYKKI